MSLLIIPAVLLLFLIRARWLHWQVESYTAKALWYLWRTKQAAGLAGDMSQIWPIAYIMLELWRWDFRRYVLDHETYDQMEVFIAKELERNDLTMELFNEKDPS